MATINSSTKIPRWSDIITGFKIEAAPILGGAGHDDDWRLQRLSAENSPPPPASKVLSLLDVRHTIVALIEELALVNSNSRNLREWFAGASRVMQTENRMVSIAILTVILCLCLTLMSITPSRSGLPTRSA